MELTTGTAVVTTATDILKNESVFNKTVGVMGMLFPYSGLRQKAIEIYIKDIEKSDLPAETKAYMVLNTKKTFKKIMNQKAVAEIAMENAGQGTDFSDNSGVSEEWLDRFMDSASFVSSEEMQLVWGKILACELEQPGSIPRNMTRILSEFNQKYAEAFRTLCSMRVLLVSLDEDEKVVDSSWRSMIVFNKNEDYMRAMGLSFELLNELETIGVIKLDDVSGYGVEGVSEEKVLIYVNGNTLETNSHQGNVFPVGNVLLTAAGEALMKITEVYEIDGYEDAIKRYLNSVNIMVNENSIYNVVVSGEGISVDRKSS